jgi:hypothetical protein
MIETGDLLYIFDTVNDESYEYVGVVYKIDKQFVHVLWDFLSGAPWRSVYNIDDAKDKRSLLMWKAVLLEK